MSSLKDRWIPRVGWKQFFIDLKNEISEDNTSNGAAALAYYFVLAIFPAAIFLLTLLPYLPIQNLDQNILSFAREMLPGEAADLLTGTVQQITSQKTGGLLSFGLLFTIWAASNGLYAIMQELNITYDVKEGRPFWKVRGTAILLTLAFGALMLGGFSLIVLGDLIQGWVAEHLANNQAVLIFFGALRWLIIAAAISFAFALTYYFGPDVEQKFRFITPGSVMGTVILALASLGFKIYVSHFGNYSATYGTLGAGIILLLWLYITGGVILLGSEINALMEHYNPEGKNKGEKKESEAA